MAEFDAFPEFRFEDDKLEENEWLVKERIDNYLANGGSVSPLIRFLTSFRIMGASDKDHLMLSSLVGEIETRMMKALRSTMRTIGRLVFSFVANMMFYYHSHLYLFYVVRIVSLA